MNHVARFNDWLQRATTAVPDVVHDLLALSGHEWREFLDSLPYAERMGATRKLIERAHSMLSRSPKDAVPVSRLAVNIARSLQMTARAETSLTDGQRDAAVDMEGDAWREHAHALFTIGDYDEARKAADEAAFVYRLRLDEVRIPDDDGSLLKLLLSQCGFDEELQKRLERAAILGLITGQILHGQGEHEEGLRLVEQSCNVLLDYCDQKQKYVQGRTIYALLLAEQRRYAEAEQVFSNTEKVARELGDVATVAYLINSIGWVHYTYLGNLAKARATLEVAMQMFEALGLKAEALRPRTTCALILVEEGQYGAAVSELYISRQMYLEAGLPNEAAAVMLRIIRAFILWKRQDKINWSEMEKVFESAGLRREAERALEYLREISAIRPLTKDDVEEAHAMLQNAGSDEMDDASPAEAG